MKAACHALEIPWSSWLRSGTGIDKYEQLSTQEKNCANTKESLFSTLRAMANPLAGLEIVPCPSLRSVMSAKLNHVGSTWVW